MSAVRILMRDVKSNRSASGVFAKTHENAREKARGQREGAERNQTKTFRRVLCRAFYVDLRLETGAGRARSRASSSRSQWFVCGIVEVYSGNRH